MPGVKCTIVELCVFKRTVDQPLFLVLQRAESERLYPGMWQIITGRIRRSEKAAKAALRELREETGLTPERLWIAPLVSSFFSLAGDRVELCPLFAVEVGRAAEPLLSKEHQQYEWATFERTKSLLVWPGHHESVRLVMDYIVNGSEAGRLTEIKPEARERKIK
jgi:dATP pyrophosphohydrolase